MARPEGPPPLHSVQVVSSTWARDSHDLFDFEANLLHTKAFTVNRSSMFVRSGTDVQMTADSAPQPGTTPPLEVLLRLVQKEGGYVVDKAASVKKLWQVVRDLDNSCHSLSENDVLKLGRFKFRVQEMVASSCDGVQPQLRLNDFHPGPICRTDESTREAALTNSPCRICLLEGTEDENDPLIRPCQCKGSIEYVHLGCLRHWIKGRLSLSDTSGSYFYRPLACELCRTTYPAYIHTGTEKETLVEVPKTTPPFIVLENMVRDSQQHTSRGLHVISLADNKLLKLGRGHESDIRIADVSISRCHATVRFHRGQFILEDHNSKFGTLVSMRKPRQLEVGSHFSVQVGRTVISLTLQPQNEENGQTAGGEHETSL